MSTQTIKALTKERHDLYASIATFSALRDALNLQLADLYGKISIASKQLARSQLWLQTHEGSHNLESLKLSGGYIIDLKTQNGPAGDYLVPYPKERKEKSPFDFSLITTLHAEEIDMERTNLEKIFWTWLQKGLELKSIERAIAALQTHLEKLETQDIPRIQAKIQKDKIQNQRSWDNHRKRSSIQ